MNINNYELELCGCCDDSLYEIIANGPEYLINNFSKNIIKNKNNELIYDKIIDSYKEILNLLIFEKNEEYTKFLENEKLDIYDDNYNWKYNGLDLCDCNPYNVYIKKLENYDFIFLVKFITDICMLCDKERDLTDDNDYYEHLYFCMADIVWEFLGIKENSGFDYILMQFLEGIKYVEHGSSIRGAYYHSKKFETYDYNNINELTKKLFKEYYKL